MAMCRVRGSKREDCGYIISSAEGQSGTTKCYQCGTKGAEERRLRKNVGTFRLSENSAVQWWCTLYQRSQRGWLLQCLSTQWCIFKDIKKIT